MRHAMPVTALAALLITGTAFAKPPAQPPKSSAPAASAASAATPAGEKLSPADRKRMQAIQQYQHDLVSVVALRADPDYLLGAAMLAKPFQNPTQGLDFDALSQRAAAAPDAGAAAEWARLDVCKSEKDCPNAQAFAWLKQHATDNAAVWMVALDVAARDKDDKAERAALKQAAAAKTYDDYFGRTLAGVAKATAVLPPLPDTMQGAHDGQPDNADGVRMLVAVMSTQAHIRPAFGPLEQLCGDEAAKDDELTSDCRQLAHTLQWGSSPIARAVGLHIQGTLKPGEKSRNEQASQNLAWQVHEYSSLLQRALTDGSQASQWLTTARNGGTELSLMLSTLRANQVPLEAPAPDGAASTGQ
jgi:hypothetical protein